MTPASLPVWTLNGGTQGANGELLNTVEYAGFLTLAADRRWSHSRGTFCRTRPPTFCPRATRCAERQPHEPQSHQYRRSGRRTGRRVLSYRRRNPVSGIRAARTGLRLRGDQSAGGRRSRSSASSATTPRSAYGAQFAITTFGQRSHPDVPAEFDVYVDVNNDGTPTWLFSTPTSASRRPGRIPAKTASLSMTSPPAWRPVLIFYTIADLDSANAILTVPLSALPPSQACSCCLDHLQLPGAGLRQLLHR